MGIDVPSPPESPEKRDFNGAVDGVRSRDAELNRDKRSTVVNPKLEGYLERFVSDVERLHDKKDGPRLRYNMAKKGLHEAFPDLKPEIEALERAAEDYIASGR